MDTASLSPTHDTLRRKAPATPFDLHPLLAIWELTQACDLVCAHCRACATTRRDPLELSTGEGKKLLTDIAAMGTPLLVLTGGDPAKRADLVELVEHGAKAGLTMAVTPSGTPLMTRALLGQLKEAGMARLAVSIDAPDAAAHDAFRGVRDSFRESRRILSEARELGIEVQVNTSIGPHNLASLAKMAELVAELGAVLWSVFVVVPTGRADASLLLAPEDLERVLVWLAELAPTVPFDVKTTAAPHFRRVMLEHHAKRNTVGLLEDIDETGAVKGHRGINDGSGFLFVSHHGDVFPSGFLPVSAGNVRRDDLAELYRHSPLFTRLRDESALEGKCGVCAFRRVCGGSRARAYAMTGNYMAEDPSCAYVPPQWSRTHATRS